MTMQDSAPDSERDETAVSDEATGAAGVDTVDVDGDVADSALPTTVDDDDADEDTDDTDDTDDEDADDETEAGSGNALLVQEGDIAADYLERLLDIVDFDGDIDLDVENDRAIVAIVGEDLDSLVGPRGETLDALQELTRLAVAQKTGTRSRLMLDISGHREQRRIQLRELASATAQQVKSSGAPERLQPMNPFERKVVHDVVAGVAGVRSESEGEEPSRRVVVLPDGN